MRALSQSAIPLPCVVKRERAPGGALAQFRGLAAQATVIVCGPSLHDLRQPERFITIGVNDVGRLFDQTYLMADMISESNRMGRNNDAGRPTYSASCFFYLLLCMGRVSEGRKSEDSSLLLRKEGR